MKLLARLYLRGQDSASPPWCADCGTVLCRGVDHGADDCARTLARWEATAALGDPWARAGAMPAPVRPKAKMTETA